jgi:hypothetical protein
LTKIVITIYFIHLYQKYASLSQVMYYLPMRTTITLDDDVHEFASVYAAAKGMTLSAAISDLVRKAEAAPQPPPDIRRGPGGLPMFPPSGMGRLITDEMVKKLEDEEFDSEKFA